MGAFDTPSKFDPAKNNTVVKFGEKRPVLETELNELQEIQNHARAEIVRQMVHSGILDYNPITVGTSASTETRKGVPYLYSNNSALNVFNLTETNVLLNGYTLNLRDFGRISPINKLNDINLPAPPTFGSREDLVFLEAWFENIDVTKDATIQDTRVGIETTQRTQLKWRIRTVAGVDFGKYVADGFSKGTYYVNNNTEYNILVSPQGSKSTPIEITSADDTSGRKKFQHYNQRSQTWGNKQSLDDKGIYIAGDGSQTSKDEFGTADGYVYSIPLFRVKRRNSGGYRSDNVNGARDYVETNSTGSTVNFTIGVPVDISLVSTVGFKAGDKGFMLNASFPFIINEVKSGTIMNITFPTTTGNFTSGYKFYLQSDRPDGKYSNIIDKDDIIDLRHKVSLTGYSPQQLLDSEFDKFMRGENQVNQKITMAKERFGLTPAPIGTPVNLVPTKVLGNDLVERELVNLLGVDGDCEDTSKWLGWTSVSVSSVDDPVIGKKAIKISPTIAWARVYKDLKLVGGKYYLYAIQAKRISGTGNLYANIHKDTPVGTSITGKSSAISSSSYTLGYTAFLTPLDITTASLTLENSVANDVFHIDAIRVYEIDQATYDKIDVDPLFTGEELAKKFPYVSSYPNVVENLVPPSSSWEQGAFNNSDGNAVSSSNHIRTKDFTIVKPSTIYFVSSALTLNVYEYKADGSFNRKNNAPTTITTMADTVKVKFEIYKATGMTVGEFDSTKSKVEGIYNNPYAPYGRWFLPTDYANGDTPTRLVDYTDHRQTFSDAQTTETRTELVEALRTPQKNIKVTQATEGTWAVGDTIKVSSQDGIIGGLLDADSALAKILGVTDGTNDVLALDDVSKFSVNDTFRVLNPDGTVSSEYSVTAIDTTNKTITVNTSNFTSSGVGSYLVESTASTSSPVVTATGIAGTWTNLGTKEATYTITTAPTTTNTTIKIDYAVHYPAGKGINNLPSENLAPKVNGLNYVSGTTLKLKANFEGKVYNSTDANPHISKHTYSNTYVSPSGSWSYEASQANYDKLKLLGEPSGTYAPSTIENGKYAQNMFSFNLIEEYERSYGRIPALTVADKVAWLKANITKLVCNWYGFGSSVGGNKANFTSFNVLGSSWYAPSSNTASIVTKISNVISGSPTSTVDANGFAHFLAYAEPSDGVTASTIETDYVELEIELNVAETGYDVFVPEETKPVLTTSPLLHKEGENLLPPFDSGDWALHVNAKRLNSYELQLDATTNYQESAVTFDVLPNTNYIVSFEKNDKYFVVSTTAGYGSGALFNWVSGTSKTFNSGNNSKLRLYITNMDSLGTFTFKNPMLTLGSAPKPFRAGAKKSRKKNLFDFLGKVAGDTFSNPHKGYKYGNASFIPPSSGITGNEVNYSDLYKQDGVLHYNQTASTGLYYQNLFEFDLSHLGLSLSELKMALRKITATVVGYGSGDNASVKTYGLDAQYWDASTNQWIWRTTVNTSNSPVSSSSNFTTLTSTTVDKVVTKDQKFYLLVHSKYPASATNASEVFIDYVKLEVELADYVDTVKKNVVKVRNVTKELKLHYPPKSEVNGMKDAVEVWYKHMPVSDIITASTDVTILAEGDGFLASDLSTSVGTKQGTHHYLNPLYKVGDNRLDVFGNFGFANVPFASDTKGVNIGAKISVYGTGFRTGYTRQYGLPVIKKPMIGIARFLVNHAGELKMLVLTRYSNTGALELVDSSLVKGFLIAISGKPLTKDADGVSRSTMTDNTAWKTPNGEIQGYLNENGEVIATYQ